MREISVEKRVVALARGRQGEALKLTGYTGIPDRLVIVPDNIMVFVETKRPKGGTISPAQKIWHKALRRMKFKVYVCCTKEEVSAMFEEIDQWR